MTAAELVAEVGRRGFKVIVSPDGPFLHRVETVAHLPGELVAEIKTRREEVLAYLAGRGDDAVVCDVCDRMWFCSEQEARSCVQSPAFCDKPARRTTVRDGDGTDRGSPPCPWK